MSENEVRQAAMLLEVRRMLDSAVSTTTIFNLEIGNSPAYLKASQVLADAMLDTRLGGIGTVFGSLNGQSGRTESEAIAKALQLMRSKI